MFKGVVLPKIALLPNRETQQEERIRNAEIRRNTVSQPYIQNYNKENYVYSWRKTLAPAYVNNKIDCENELKIWEYNWSRTQQIIKKIASALNSERCNKPFRGPPVHIKTRNNQHNLPARKKLQSAK